jgi:hypothetical protein
MEPDKIIFLSLINANLAAKNKQLNDSEAKEKYKNVCLEVQTQIFGKSLKNYMVDFDNELLNYSVAHKTENDENWDRLTLAPPNIEYLPKNGYIYIKSYLQSKYSKLKTELEKEKNDAMNLQKVEDTLKPVGDLLGGLFDLSKFLLKYGPYIGLGIGALFIYNVIRK